MRDLAHLSRRARRLRPVFIVGEARSGTTLLYRLLQQQPAFGPSPVHLVESHFLTTLLARPTLDDAATWPMRNFLKVDDDAWARFHRAVGPLLRVRRAIMRARSDALGNPSVATAAGLGVVARAYVALAAEVRCAERLVEKTPTHVRYMGHLVRWFPRAKVLYLARHPVDVITSYWRRAEDDPRTAGWAAVDVDTFVQRYRTNVAVTQGWAERRPEQVRLLRYEDLVDDPPRVVEALLRFLDAPFAPDTVSGDNRVGDRGDQYVWGDVRRQTKDWHHFIDLATAVDIERRLESTMVRLGYAPHAALG